MKKNLLFIIALITGVLLYAQPENLPVTPGGIHYQFHKQYEGYKPKTSDWVKIHIINRNAAGEKIFSTYDGQGQAVEFQLADVQFNGDIVEGLHLMSEGDSATFVIKSDSIYRGANMPDFTKPGEWIYYVVKMVDIQTPAEHAEETKQKNQTLMKEQLKEIKDTLNHRGIDYQEDNNGLIYYIEQEGEGPHPQIGETVEVHYTGWLLNGKKFDSSVDRGQTFSFMLGQGRVIKGWEDALVLLRKGSKGMFYLPSALAYGDRGAGEVIPPNSILKFEIELIDVTNKDKVIEQDLETIKSYLKENGLSATQSPYGLFYKIDVPGTGPKAHPGDKIKVHYTGKLLDGTVFDSSVSRGEPIEFTLGRGMVIEGWEKGLMFFNKGSKGTIYLPSPLAYGNKAAGSIPANSILIFDIEMVDIEKQ